jgi:hypothetical protein
MAQEVDARQVKVYIAGKVSKDSVFGKHHWRDEFCAKIEKLSGLSLKNLDPVKTNANLEDYSEVFGCDCYLISKADVVLVYLSDDISIGGSQEIMIAKYLKKPVIGLAPMGGKFNGSTKEYAHGTVHNYKDPFVFSTCDVVCGDIEGVAENIKKLGDVPVKDISLIDEAIRHYAQDHLNTNDYIRELGL